VYWDIPGCADDNVPYLHWRDQCHCHLYPTPREAEEVHHQVQQFPHSLHRRDDICCSWAWLVFFHVIYNAHAFSWYAYYHSQLYSGCLCTHAQQKSKGVVHGGEWATLYQETSTTLPIFMYVCICWGILEWNALNNIAMQCR